MPSRKVSMRASMSNQTTHFGIMGGLYNRKISGRSSMNRVTSRLEIPASAKEGYPYMKMHNLLSRNPLGSGGVGRMFSLRARGSSLGSSGLGSSGLGSSLDKKPTEKRVVTYVTSWGVAPADFWPKKTWPPPSYLPTAGVWDASQNQIWKTLLTNTTHIMFAFGVNYPSIDSLLNPTPLTCTYDNLKGLLDVNMNPTFMAQIRATRHQTNSNTKMLLSIGGGQMQAEQWQTCIGGEKPTDFDNAANAFWDVVHYLGLDGIDIDIEVDASGGAAIFTNMLEAFIRTRPSRSPPLSTVPLLITAAPDIRQLAPSATDAVAVAESEIYIEGLRNNADNIDFISVQNYNGYGISDSPGCAPYGTNIKKIFDIAKGAMNNKANKVVSMVCSDGGIGCDWGCQSKSASGMEIDKDDSAAAYSCSPHGRSGAGQPFDAKQLICQYKDYDSGNGGFGYWSANIGNTNTPTGAQLAVELTNAIKSVGEAEEMCPASVCADTGTSNY